MGGFETSVDSLFFLNVTGFYSTFTARPTEIYQVDPPTLSTAKFGLNLLRLESTGPTFKNPHEI